jgi:hypothetical protein
VDGWRYLFFQLNGDGTETLLDGNVKLSNPSLTRVLSGPHQISATLNQISPSLLQNGQLQIRRWRTSVMAESPSGEIWVGGVIADFSVDGPTISFDITGFTTYAKKQPFDAEYEGVDVDPLDVVRTMWAHLQSRNGGHLGLELDATTTPVRIGTPAEQVDFTTSTGENVNFVAGPVKLNWWSTDDIGGKFDDFASSTPFDYVEEHTWDDDVVAHSLRIGFPALGSRKDELRFVLGENVFKMPTEQYDEDDVVTEVWVFGAGEGRDRVRGVASVAPRDSLRRVKTVDDKTITSKEKAFERASAELFRYQPDIPGAGVVELVIQDKGSAPFGSYDVGDEIRYSGDHDLGVIDIWVTVLKLTAHPESGNDLIATVVRSDTIR